MDGISVNLSSGAATTTSNGGYYQFSDVEGGTYTVTISGFPTDASFDATSAEVTISTTGQTITRNFSGSYIRTASLMGMVTVEGVGLPGITVDISGRDAAQTTTDANGQYTFTGLRAGNYTVEISDFDPTDVAFSDNSGAVTIAVGESKVRSFDGVYVRESTISGQVSVQGNGLSGVTVSLQGMGSDEEAMTDNGGQYTFDNLRAGEYQVAISGYDTREYGFETTSATIRVEHGKTANQPFEGIMLRTASIMGQVSVEGEGLAEVTVSLSGEGENQTTMTDQSGQYTFTDLPAGNFQVGISGYDTDDYSFETTSRNVSLALGATATVPFEGILLRTSGISGRVSVEGMGLDSVTVTLSGDDLEEDATAMTDATGQYAFAGLAEGDYTVAISDFDNVSYVFENTSMDVTLGDDDVQIHNFMGMHARTGMISGMLFVDEAGKNDAYDEGEDALATPGILLSLIGPDESIIAPRPGATNASGMFMFDKLRAGAYQLVVNPRNLNPAIPADYAYGGSSTGYQFTLGVGGEATQNIPFDITHTTVNFMVNLKAGAAMGDALPGATVSFFSDMAGEQKIGDAMSGDDGMASMRIARTSASNNTVYAKVAAPAGDYATDMAMQAVMWDAKMTMHAASNASDILNTKADFSFSGATVMTEYGGGKALAGWAITVSSDKSAAADAPAKLGDDGSAKYSEVVAADSLPVKYTVNVASNQDNALDGGEKYSAGKTGLTYTHNGLSLPATMDAGMLEVKYTTQTLKVYVHHERDQVMGYTGNILGGDVRNTGTVNVDIRHIERSSGRSRAFNPNTEWNSGGGRKTDSNGVVTFRGVPANAQVIVQASLASDAGNVRLLRPDELAAYTDRDGNNIMGGAFGDNGGYHHTVELCPLMATDPTGQRFGECASFAFVNTHLVHGQVWKHDFVPAANGDGWTERNLRHVPGTTVTLAPVAGENLAGDGEGFTAAAADNRRTPLDERKQFNWGQKAAGVYKVTVPAGWVARVGAPGTNVALGNSFNPLAGDVQIDVTPTTGFAYGRVTGEDGFPVAGVTVNVNGVTATTDAAGRYTAGGFASQTRRISNVTYANRIFVEITHTGHNFSRTIRPFAANAPEMVNVELEGATKTATIAGRVTAAGTGDAVAGARVWVDYGAGATNPLGVSARTGLLTGSDGSYSATVVAQPAGSTVGISVTKSDMSFTPASIDVGALEGSSISGISFTGFMKATITGRVSNNGRPMDGVKVKAMAVGGSAAADSATTGETGSYRLFVPFGTYDVEASKAGFNFTPTNQRVNVGPGATTSIDDFAAVVVPSSDATLSDLMLSNDVSLAPTFASDVTAYTASAPNSVAQITVTATTANAGADAVIMPTDADDAAAGHQVDLAVGANEITVTVTAADGSTTETYTVTVTRREPAAQDDADLASLSLSDGTLDPAFASGTTSYTAEVANTVEQVTVTAGANHAEAEVAITPEDADGTAAGHQVALTTGANTITVTVTAADGTTTKDYTITVNRGADVPSAPQQLAITSPNSGALAVTWRAPANEGADGILGYQVRRAGQAWTNVPAGTLTDPALVRTATVTGVVDGRSTAIEVRALASVDATESPPDSTFGDVASITGMSWPEIAASGGVVADSSTMAEGSTTMVTVTLNHTSFFTPTRVAISIRGDAAATAASSTITFQPGDLTRTVAVTATDNVTAGDATADFIVSAKVAEPGTEARDSVDAAAVTVNENDVLPGAPTIDSVSVGNGTLTINLSPPSAWGNGAATSRMYQYRYSAETLGASDQWITVAVGNIALSNLTNGATYNLEVRAMTEAGEGPSATSTGTPSSSQ